jgi:Rod binding domain-containing protein
MNDIKIHNQLSIIPTDQTNRSKDIKLKDSTEKMEAAFLNFVFKEMEKTIQKVKIDESSDNNLSSMMFSTVMADSIAEQGGFGLSETIYTSLAEKSFGSDLELLKNNADNFINVIELMKLKEMNSK